MPSAASARKCAASASSAWTICSMVFAPSASHFARQVSLHNCVLLPIKALAPLRGLAARHGVRCTDHLGRFVGLVLALRFPRAVSPVSTVHCDAVGPPT